MEKILDFQRAGKTLLFVSHVASAVQQLCGRALWLDHGELIMNGTADEVIAAYNVHSPGTLPPGIGVSPIISLP